MMLLNRNSYELAMSLFSLEYIKNTQFSKVFDWQTHLGKCTGVKLYAYIYKIKDIGDV